MDRIYERIARDPRLGRMLLRNRRARSTLEGVAPTSVYALESAGAVKAVAPSSADEARVAAFIRGGAGITLAEDPADSASVLAQLLIKRAQAIMAGAEDAFRHPSDYLALESVVLAEGRPALRVGADAIQDPDEWPGSQMWRSIYGAELGAMLKATAACGAVMVHEMSGLRSPKLQGTAWLIAQDKVVTNRHVLRPPAHLGAEQLVARRADDTVRGRIRPGLTLLLDFSRFGTGMNQNCARVEEVLYIAEEKNPVDMAVLRIDPPQTMTPLTLQPSGSRILEDLYVVGHPGLLPLEGLDAKTLKVFGNPDGTKRLSLGCIMHAGEPVEKSIRHDCSTIGGYSGGPVLEPRGHTVVGLHYAGDPINGNRAAKAFDVGNELKARGFI